MTSLLVILLVGALCASAYEVSFEGLPLNEINEMEHVAAQRIEHFQQHKKDYQQTHQEKGQGWAAFEQIVGATLNCPQKPRSGVVLSVFKGDQILYSNGFGYADIANAIPLTTRSLLAIGSVTKPITSTILASLAAQGKFDWNADVRTYLPELQFPSSSAFFSQKITAVDLVAHRLGIGSTGNSMWITQENGLPENALALQYLSPSTTFRTKMDYCNIGVTTAGYIGMLLQNATWEELVKEEIFDKLGMSDSLGTWKEAVNSGRYTKCYGVINGALQEYLPAAQQSVDLVAPAGSIFSTVEDMIKFLRLHLALGKNEKGEQVIPTEFLAATQAAREVYPSSPIQLGFAPFSLALTTAAMGWLNGNFNGRTFLWHNGGLSGATSFAMYMPTEDLGMIYISNTDNGNLDFYSVMIAGLEVALQGWTSISPSNVCTFPCPWKPECFVPLMKGKDQEKKPDMTNFTRPYDSLNDYVGVFKNPAFGTANVQLSDKPEGGLKILLGVLECYTLAQNRDVFTGLCNTGYFLTPRSGLFSFGRTFEGQVDKVVIPLFDPEPITFTNSAYWPQSWLYPRRLPQEL